MHFTKGQNQNQNQNINTFIIMKQTRCLQQKSDTIFEETNDVVNELEIYEGEIVCKRNGKYYLSLGYDLLLDYDVYVPVLETKSKLNMMLLKDYQRITKFRSFQNTSCALDEY